MDLFTHLFIMISYSIRFKRFYSNLTLHMKCSSLIVHRIDVLLH